MDLDLASDFLVGSLPVITFGTTFALTAAGVYLKNKYQNNRLIQALVMLDQVVISVVSELNETVVTELKQAKADGKLSRDEAEQIKNKAIDLVLKRMGIGFVGILNRSVGSYLELIASKIEAAVFDAKCSRRKAVNCKNQQVKYHRQLKAVNQQGGL